MKAYNIVYTRNFICTDPLSKSLTDPYRYGYSLKFYENRFSMKLDYCNQFFNWAYDICDWPVIQWSLEQVRECVRIFETEYFAMCKICSILAEDKYFVHRTTRVSRDNPSYEENIVSDDKDIAICLWNMIQQVSVWIPHPYRDPAFMICASCHDAGYVEERFPFRGAVTESGKPIESILFDFEKELPTLVALARHQT